jgi:hypothetical protein
MFGMQQVFGPPAQAPQQVQGPAPQQISGATAYYPMQTTGFDMSTMMNMMMMIMMMGMMMGMMKPMFSSR